MSGRDGTVRHGACGGLTRHRVPTWHGYQHGMRNDNNSDDDDDDDDNTNNYNHNQKLTQIRTMILFDTFEARSFSTFLGFSHRVETRRWFWLDSLQSLLGHNTLPMRVNDRSQQLIEK